MSRFFLILFVLASGAHVANAQREQYDLTTPHNSLRLFLENLQDDNYKPEIAALTLGGSLKQAEKQKLAEKLKQFLDGKGVYVRLNEVPHDANFLDSTNYNKAQYQLSSRYPELYVEHVGRNWKFSPESVSQIERLHKEAFPFGTDKLLELIPMRSGFVLFGIRLWQYVAILILVVLSFVIFRILTWLTRMVFLNILFRYGYKDVARMYVLPVAKPISYALMLWLFQLFIPVVQLPVKTAYYITMGVNGLLPLFATLAFYRFVDIVSLYFQKLSSKTESTLDDQLVPLFRKILKAFVIVIGALYILQNLDINIVPLLATLSIGGLAFALAAQDTLKNFFGSIMIFVDKPFQVGHWITADGIDGTVEEVGLRSTRIRTFRNSLVYVPNSKLADSTVDNHGLRQYRRYFTQIAVTYDTPADLIEVFLEGLRQIVKDHPHTRKDYYNIYLDSMGDSSLNIMFYVFFSAPTWGKELEYKQDLILAIIRLAEKLGVNFAFPTQTLHMENFPGKTSLSPSYDSIEQSMDKKDDFFQSKPKS